MSDSIPSQEKVGAVQAKPENQKWYHIFKDAPDIGRHAASLVLALISVWLVHLVLKNLLGQDAKFFDWIPIRYATDFADIVLIAKFVWHLIKNFNK